MFYAIKSWNLHKLLAYAALSSQLRYQEVDCIWRFFPRELELLT